MQAVVTGASQGIGRAIAERFLAAGWMVHNLSRRPCSLPEVRNHEVDLADLGAVARVADSLVQGWEPQQRLCVVHNAAILDEDGLGQLDPGRFERVLRVNVTAPALLTQALRPCMAPGSSVLFIGSTLSEQAVASRMSYVTSKHAVVGLMRSVCQDLHGSGIHTACICPGFTDTEMVRSLFATSPGLEMKVREMVSFGRLIASEEIATLVYQVAEQPILNGSVVHANLGQRSQ